MTRRLMKLKVWLDGHIAAARADDQGAVTTETAIVTAALAAGAVAVTAIIVVAATGHANSIPVVGG